IGIDHVIDQRRETLQALLARPPPRAHNIVREHAGRGYIAQRIHIASRRGASAPPDPAADTRAALARPPLAASPLEPPRSESRRDGAAAACGVWHDHQNPAGGELLRETRTMSKQGQRRHARGGENTAPADGRDHVLPPVVAGVNRAGRSIAPSRSKDDRPYVV